MAAATASGFCVFTTTMIERWPSLCPGNGQISAVEHRQIPTSMIITGQTGSPTGVLGTFDADKNETRHPVESVDEIYDHAETIRESVRNYLD